MAKSRMYFARWCTFFNHADRYATRNSCSFPCYHANFSNFLGQRNET
jgi:hypothetical protein